jgi:hypothetical protein
VSKLVEKLGQASQGSPQPLGFRGAGSTATQKGSPMVLIVALAEGDAGAAPDDKARADAVLLAKAESQVVDALGEALWGVSLDKGTDEQLTQLKGMGCDFLVFEPATAPSSLLGEEALGKIVEIEPDMADGMLRAIDKLPIDAVLLGGDTTLSVHRLMVCQHLANLVHKPLIARVHLDASKEALEELRETGVTGVVVTLSARDRKGLSRLRQAIDSLPAVRKRRKERVEAVLPSLGREATVEEEEEDLDLGEATTPQLGS